MADALTTTANAVAHRCAERLEEVVLAIYEAARTGRAVRIHQVATSRADAPSTLLGPAWAGNLCHLWTTCMMQGRCIRPACDRHMCKVWYHTQHTASTAQRTRITHR